MSKRRGKNGHKRIRKAQSKIPRQNQQTPAKTKEPKCSIKPKCTLANICCPTYHKVCGATVTCCEKCNEKPFCPMFPYMLEKKNI